MARDTRRTLCLDFDGVLHDYHSGWHGANVIPDKLVPGAVEFLSEATKHFRVVIYSTRSNEGAGIIAMHKWLRIKLEVALGWKEAERVLNDIHFPVSKPPAHLTIDDRAMTFTGKWPTMSEIAEFKPWNK